MLPRLRRLEAMNCGSGGVGRSPLRDMGHPLVLEFISKPRFWSFIDTVDDGPSHYEAIYEQRMGSPQTNTQGAGICDLIIRW